MFKAFGSQWKPGVSTRLELSIINGLSNHYLDLYGMFKNLSLMLVDTMKQEPVGYKPKLKIWQCCQWTAQTILVPTRNKKYCFSQPETGFAFGGIKSAHRSWHKTAESWWLPTWLSLSSHQCILVGSDRCLMFDMLKSNPGILMNWLVISRARVGNSHKDQIWVFRRRRHQQLHSLQQL